MFFTEVLGVLCALSFAVGFTDRLIGLRWINHPHKTVKKIAERQRKNISVNQKFGK
jgi:hypothetical protein